MKEDSFDQLVKYAPVALVLVALALAIVGGIFVLAEQTVQPAVQNPVIVVPTPTQTQVTLGEQNTQPTTRAAPQTTNIYVSGSDPVYSYRNDRYHRYDGYYYDHYERPKRIYKYYKYYHYDYNWDGSRNSYDRYRYGHDHHDYGRYNRYRHNGYYHYGSRYGDHNRYRHYGDRYYSNHHSHYGLISR